MYKPFLARRSRLEHLFDADYFAPFRSLDHVSLLLNNIDVKGRLAGRAPVHQSLYLWSKTALPGYILTLLGDRMEMAHSIEGRVPFLGPCCRGVSVQHAGQSQDPRPDREVHPCAKPRATS
jgi:asparagine synthetase B (glutamine-hydrolysing)